MAGGSLGALGLVASSRRQAAESISVRVWLSEQAATYSMVTDRIEAYLGAALDLEFWTVDIAFSGVQSVSTEDGAAVSSGGEWPTIVGRKRIAGDAVGDVNLLVTDGQMQTTPTGFGLPHVASVGGARYIHTLPPREKQESLVPLTTPNRVIQVLIHEVGHALGLAHDHGVVFESDGALVASPMISTYAWDPDSDIDRSRCGDHYPDGDGTGAEPEPEVGAGASRKLLLSYSACAEQTLRGYQGSVVRL